MIDVKSVADQVQISDVISRYCRYIDDAQGLRAAELFASDAVMFAMGRELRGRDEIAAFLPQLPDKRRRPSSIHLISNCVIDVEGDLATAESDWVMLDRTGAGHLAQVRMAGRYCDRLRRDGRQWLITERDIVALARPA